MWVSTFSLIYSPWVLVGQPVFSFSLQLSLSPFGLSLETFTSRLVKSLGNGLSNIVDYQEIIVWLIIFRQLWL